MASIGWALSRVKQDLKGHVPAERIESICREMNHGWRDRTLGPAQTIWLFVLQLLNRNTALSHVRHLSDRKFTAGALCQAKKRLPLEVVRRLVEWVGKTLCQSEDGKRQWHGHRLFGADVTCYRTADTRQLRGRFGLPPQKKTEVGYPMVKALSLLALCSGAILHQIPLPANRQEAPLVIRLLRWLKPGDVLIMDRAFASFANLALMMRGKVEAIIRLPKGLLGGGHARRGKLKRLGECDWLVRWRLPAQRLKWLSPLRWKELPAELVLRQITFSVCERGFRSRRITVITTLLDPTRYPAGQIAGLYRRRWELEINFRHLKQTLQMDWLRAKTVVGVKKELLIRALAYNLVRVVMLEASVQQNVPPQRISFIDALRWLLSAGIGEELPELIVNPLRPGRFEPRLLKRRDKNYRYLQCSRSQAKIEMLKKVA